jgi:hypothetical protein
MVNAMDYVRIEKFDTICEDARSACANGVVHNLLLAYEFDIGVTQSQFVNLHEAEASAWQSASPPPNLPFSHGQYFKGDDGMRHVIRELKSKSASRRALVSLVGMDDVLDTGDKAIPSFMIAQFGVIADCLYVTEYFRALEVGRFLPINLAETSLMIRRITREVSRPKTIRFLLLAFQAHLTPDFHCLEIASLDIVIGAEIGVAVTNREFGKLLSWLQGKRKYESEVLTRGLEQMTAAAKLNETHYSPLFISSLDQAVRLLSHVKQLRGASSDEEQIREEYAKYLTQLDVAIQELGRIKDGV